MELLLESEENNFRDKTLDPTFGGAGFPPRFPSSLTFSLLMPLGRGRGNTSVAAQERASVFTVRAREEQGRQIATEEVYRTLLAYIRLIAAQENLKLAQASSERQKVLVGLTDQRVRGGEAARVEGFRAQARQAFVESSVAGAQAELVDARMSLAEAMGIDAATLGEAPAAADRFADVRVDQQTVAQLIASAMESRRDRLALDQARQASAALAAGARRRYAPGLRPELQRRPLAGLRERDLPLPARRAEPDLQRAERAEAVRRDAPLLLAARLLARAERPLGAVRHRLDLVRDPARQQRGEGPAGGGAGDAAVVGDPGTAIGRG